MRRPLIGAGLLIMGYGVLGAILDADVNLVGVLVFGAVLLVLHDGFFLPLVAGVGRVLRRFVPARWQATVRLAAITDLAVIVVALPLVLGFGRDAGNPTVLPRPYGKGLLLILILVPLVALTCRKGIERFRGARRR
ncbi:hypothetical protein [Actinoplanes sp. L3-i22]|uniref:hypothetical protein n=1 Tax=Actinoplanes sp. L3-i22 TaxID=2836373 RepID=UPI001C764B36|nr:hypothetical protein [Actinoplanes sp. L3-i22]BCY11309.1 hypothetical protein L3i22_063970 [Actinoplanes sp. L3-i22]